MLLFIVFPASRRVHHRSPARHLRRTVDPSGFCTAVPVHCHALTFLSSLTGPGILLAREPMAEAGAEQELKRLCCGVAHGLIRAWATLPPWDLERPREVCNTGAREHDGAEEWKDLPNDIEQFSFPATWASLAHPVAPRAALAFRAAARREVVQWTPSTTTSNDFATQDAHRIHLETDATGVRRVIAFQAHSSCSDALFGCFL